MVKKLGWLVSTFFLFFVLQLLAAMTGLLVREPWSGAGTYPVYQLVVMVVSQLALLALYCYLAQRWGFLTWQKGLFNRKILLLLLLAFLVKWGLDALGLFWLEQLGKETTANQEALQEQMASLPVLFIMLNGGLLAPFAEELAYRGLLQDRLLVRWPLLGLVLSSLIFALGHNPSDLPSWLIYGGAGLIYGGLYLKTKNLIYPLVLHVFGNVLGLGLAFLLA